MDTTPHLPVLVPPSPPATADRTAALLEAWLGGRSPTTIRAYQGDLAALAANRGLPDAGAAAAHLVGLPHGQANEVVLRWRNAMVAANLSAATVNRRLAAARSLVALAGTLGLVPWQLQVPSLKREPRRDSRGPGTPAVRKLMITASKRGDAKGVRDVTILRLLYDLGLRRAEVCRLNLEDFDAAARRISVRGKGKREKLGLQLPPKTFDALAAWMAVRPAEGGGNPEAPLFVNLDRGAPRARLTGAGLYLAVRNLGDNAGIRVRPHGLRHAGITAALDAAKGDVREVRKFSRHSRIETVMQYDDSRQDTAFDLAKKVSDNA